jgi:hypothetical protein
MKTKKSDLVVNILVTVLVVVLAGLLIAWMTGMFKDKKKSINDGTQKIDGVLSSVAEFDLLAYDDSTVRGDVLTDLIKEYKEKGVQLAIWVITLDNTSNFYNYGFNQENKVLTEAPTATVPPSTKSDSGYITPSASFVGEVIKNTNNEIVCLKFTQQK